MKNLSGLLIVLVLGLAACQPVASTPEPTENTVAAPEETTSVVITTEMPAETTDVITMTEEATAVVTPTLEVCSPLQGFDQADLLARISNPFDPPAPGSDNPHQGVDLSDFDPADPNRIAVPGRTVQVALPGTVALVQTDRFPYGTAVIVETPLETLPADLQAQFGDLAVWPPRSPNDPLTCPTVTPAPQYDASRRSVYILYAHLSSMADLQVGEEVNCGQTLGTVGQSGNALAPHLHFEVRVGPAGARLGSLAHYDVSASEPEMAAYCDWRVSGDFIWVDPLIVLNLVK
ncbi:membrane proteins related to metalloendopeptidases [Longilinea arvoryzae]|uniref:Membrane proteins related to metalloendopeptidases n=1 Tax=Longilinea arvoryzae TaxID=360412 RepID=A0A0S7BEQ8_9CHLR|nr:M23 family metallopeptidase [Longilinea arvoryzae]GAP13396.1 membrane proteins related to metalloendopeptidases [Longilinea arvoryzae]